MLEPYQPRSYGKEYVRLKSSHQYPMFLAVALGVKPSYDDWISTELYEDFVDVCAQYGMVVEPDVIFARPEKDRSHVVGGESVTTTYQVGRRFSLDTEGMVHAIVARDRETALSTKRVGWYSVAVNNRIINKPFVDHLRFGTALGFPDCCVDFFRRFNNWRYYSHPHETLKNTPARSATASYYCNNILMDSTYFYIHHLPCSYRCPATIELARNVEKEIDEVEPNYIQQTKRLLKMPVLVFAEKHYVLFDGTLQRNRDSTTIDFSQYEYVTNHARPEENLDLSVLSEATSLMMKGGTLIAKAKDTLRTWQCEPTWFMLDFDDES